MDQYIGLDVSMKETAISIRQDGKRIWRGKCASDPQLLAAMIRKRAPEARRVVFETGPPSVWFYHALTAEGMPAICIDARHAKAALDMAANKTDANDADGLAHLAEIGFYREVRVKGFDSMLIRTLVTARRQLLKMRLQMSNQIRGLMKTFGLVVPKGAGSVFERNVRTFWKARISSRALSCRCFRPGAKSGFGGRTEQAACGDGRRGPALIRFIVDVISCRHPHFQSSVRGTLKRNYQVSRLIQSVLSSPPIPN